jgi:hypothetical protein
MKKASQALAGEFKIRANFTFTTRNEDTGEIVSVKREHNLITSAGRGEIAKRLAGTQDTTLEITHGALGDDNTAPSSSNTTLGNETTRIATSSQTYSANIAYLSYFFPAGTGTGTYEEFGNFIDGTSSPDTGTLFSHVLMSGSKAANESLTIDVSYTIE